MPANDRSDARRTFRTLGLVLVIAVAVALLFGAMDLRPEALSQGQAFAATGFVLFVIVAILVWFFMRFGSTLNDMRAFLTIVQTPNAARDDAQDAKAKDLSAALERLRSETRVGMEQEHRHESEQEDRLRQLVDRIDKLERHAEARKAASAADARQLDELNRQLREAVAARNSAESAAQSANSALATASSASRSKDVQLEERRGDRERAEKAEREVADYKRQLQDSESRRSTEVVAKQKAAADLANLQTTSARDQARLMDRQKELERDADDARARAKAAEVALESAQSNAKSSKDALAAGQSERDRLAAALAKAQQDAENARLDQKRGDSLHASQLDSATKVNQGAAKRLSDAESALADATRQLAALRDANDKAERAAATAGHELASAKAANAKLRSQVDERHAADKKREDELLKLRTAESSASATNAAELRKLRDELLAAKMAAQQEQAVTARLQADAKDAAKRREALLLQIADLQNRPAPPKHEEGQHVLLLEGIGPTYASRLNHHGIITMGQLRRAKADDVAAKIDVMPGLVEEWQAMADLMRLKGVGPQWAEALARAKVTSIADLARRDASQLAADIARLHEGKKIRIVKGEATPATVSHWIEAARTGQYDKAAQRDEQLATH